MSLRPALTDAQVRAARDARRNGVSAEALARQFKVDRSAVRNAIHGRSPYHKILDPPPVPHGVLETDRPLSDAQVREIRYAGRRGVSVSALSRQFQVARQSVLKALYGRPPYNRLRDPAPLRRPRPVFHAPLLTPDQVRLARRMRVAGTQVKDIAERLGACYKTIPSDRPENLPTTLPPNIGRKLHS